MCCTVLFPLQNNWIVVYVEIIKRKDAASSGFKTPIVYGMSWYA